MSKSNQLDIDGGLIPLEDAARLLNIKPDTIRLYLRQQRYTRYRRGRQTFLDPAELTPRPVSGPKAKPANGRQMANGK